MSCTLVDLIYVKCTANLCDQSDNLHEISLAYCSIQGFDFVPETPQWCRRRRKTSSLSPWESNSPTWITASEAHLHGVKLNTLFNDLIHPLIHDLSSLYLRISLCIYFMQRRRFFLGSSTTSSCWGLLCSYPPFSSTKWAAAMWGLLLIFW